MDALIYIYAAFLTILAYYDLYHHKVHKITFYILSFLAGFLTISFIRSFALYFPFSVIALIFLAGMYLMIFWRIKPKNKTVEIMYFLNSFFLLYYVCSYSNVLAASLFLIVLYFLNFLLVGKYINWLKNDEGELPVFPLIFSCFIPGSIAYFAYLSHDLQKRNKHL